MLVVKSAQAAKNPKVRRVHLAVAGSGLSVRAGRAGGLAVVDDTGEVVLGSGTPLMWDAGPGDERSDARAAVATNRLEKMKNESAQLGIPVDCPPALFGATPHCTPPPRP